MSRMILVLVLVAGLGIAETPEQAFDTLVNALYTADAEGLYSCLSNESVAMLNMMLLMVKADPEAAAEQISCELGTEVTAAEISGWSAMDLISTVLSAPGFIEEFPPRDDILVTGSQVTGDSCVVFFTLAGLDQELEMLMVKQEGSWKLDQSVIQAEM